MKESSRETAHDALRFAGLAVGGFVALNLAGEAVRGPFDTVPEWLSIPGPTWLRLLLEAGAAAALVSNALVSPLPQRLRHAGAILLAALSTLAVADTARFYAALGRGAIHTPAIVPASIAVALFLGASALSLFRGRPLPPWSRRRLRLAAVVTTATAIALPLLRMGTFGPTRYEHSADCAVVLGARVWNDGSPSHALSDRVDEAVELYRAGRVRRILMSGAIDSGNGFSEPEVMKARAAERGVPAEAILLDEAGVDTSSTVRNASRLLHEKELGSALVVSHYYHEPRLKMLFDRAGVRAYTVPATMKHRLLKEPWFVAREVAAFYHSFLFE